MRCLIISGSLTSGGAERQIVNLSHLLVQNGDIVEIVCYDDGDFYSASLKEKDIKVYWKTEGSKLSRFLSIRKLIRKGKYDAVISFLEMPNLINVLSGIGGRNWKIIVGIRSANRAFVSSLWGKLQVKLQAFIADAFVSNSQCAKNLYLEYFPELESKIWTIYNDIRITYDKGQSGRYVPCNNGKIHIVVAASFQPIKNALNLLESLALLDTAQRNRLRIDWYGRKKFVNDDVYYQQCEKYKHDLHLDNIFFHDEVKNISEKMASADFVGLFSLSEGFPNAICEGMALRKPILMSRVSDYDVLVDEGNGYLFNPSNPKSISNALLKCSECDADMILNMGCHSYEKFCQLFSHEKNYQNWKNIISIGRL